jgi:beta-1,4-mannosyl-glycoprotein beta-1,4-N-acetylglucosaminyltransferase
MTIKVIDSFMFFNEKNMIKLRLNYLNEVVDYFLISESNYTFSGKSKPYYLDEILKELPDDITNKIIRIKYEPDISQFNVDQKLDYCDYNSDFWKLENAQRNLITNHLSQFSSTDLFMLSDLDEIPRKEIVKEYKEVFENYYGSAIPEDFLCRCLMDFFYYNFNTYCGNRWCGTTISTVKNAIEKSCAYFRNTNSFYPIENGGFHFSTFGNVNQIREKIQSYSHQEYNKECYINDDNILNSIQNKEDMYHNGGTFTDYNFSHYPKNLRNLITKIFPAELYSL